MAAWPGINSSTTGDLDYGKMVAQLEAITAQRIEVGDWARFREYALAIGAEQATTDGPRRFDGVPVVEIEELAADQLRVCHRHPFDGTEWTACYRIPGSL